MNKQYSDDLHSLSHTKWSCKYHIVFAPKYRRRAFYEARRVEVGAILRQKMKMIIYHLHQILDNRHQLYHHYHDDTLLGYNKPFSFLQFFFEILCYILLTV